MQFEKFRVKLSLGLAWWVVGIENLKLHEEGRNHLLLNQWDPNLIWHLLQMRLWWIPVQNWGNRFSVPNLHWVAVKFNLQIVSIWKQLFTSGVLKYVLLLQFYFEEKLRQFYFEEKLRHSGFRKIIRNFFLWMSINHIRFMYIRFKWDSIKV